MKNLKKVLAMVLAFACTFTMFASAKVYDDVLPGSDYSEAITMLSDLGIIQGRSENKYEPESTITRAEACALIARLLTGDPNVSNFGNAQNFTDVTKGSWQDSAIGYCVANGITIGVGNGKFEPNRPINDQEFLTMMVRALGYETPDMKQGYPFSYMTVANAVGLRHNTNMMANTDALRGEDAQIIYNALFVDYAKGAKLINTTHGTTVEQYPTLAESVWGLQRAAVGTFTGGNDDEATLSNCKAHSWVIVGADPKNDGRVLAYPIEDDTDDIYESGVDSKNGTKHVPYSFKYAGATNIDHIKGYKVELYGEGKHGKPTWEKGQGKFVFADGWNIKAIKTVEGQTKFDYDPSKADSDDGNGTIEMNEKSLKLDSVSDNAKRITDRNTTETHVVTYLSNIEYNGKKAASNKDVEKALNVRDGAKYKLMDWDNDDHIDWIVVEEANYFKVDSVSSSRTIVTAMKVGNEETQTGSDTFTWKKGLNSEGKYKVKYELPEGLKQGDIVELTYTIAYDKGEECEVVTATGTVVEAENHELDKVSTKNGIVLQFDGQNMRLAQANDEGDTIVPTNPTMYRNFDEEELGTAFALHMNRNGFIINSDYATDSTNYMMVLDTDDGKNSVRGQLGAMKFITAGNKVETNVEVVSDLRIDGKTSGNGYDKDTRTFDETQIVGKVFKYWKDSDGRITKMESMVSAADKKANDYTYVSKNDRLTMNGQSYALEDAKVIFAVKPHDGTNDYIQHIKPSMNDLKVDSSDVLAVKASDIPDISSKDDTKPTTLDKNWVDNKTDKSWIGDNKSTIALSNNIHKDASAAVLGVSNFNKFNAGATKIGLVTNVSYDKNNVVSIDVATNGKVETISSAEKVDFGDIVKVKDYAANKDVSVASRHEKVKAGALEDMNPANGTALRDYLDYQGGAYAEVTTNADGKLTGVLFMDQKHDNDGHDDADDKKDGVNVKNVMIGNYYQISRKVVTDVKSGSWMSVQKYSATYRDSGKFQSIDTKNDQGAVDFTGDANYYVIDGKPTRADKNYNGTKASILDGFANVPKVTVGEATDVVASEIRGDLDKANDSYNVADVASKIDANGAGNIVAVYMYDDAMEEKMSIGGTTLTVPAITVGQETLDVTVALPADDKLDKDRVYVELVETVNGKQTVLQKVDVKNGKVTLNTKDLKAGGKYTVKLWGYNKTDKDYELLASADLAVNAKKMYTVTDLKWSNAAGTDVTNPTVEANTDAVFYIKVAANETTARAANPAILTKENVEVRVRGDVKEFLLEYQGNDLYKITVRNTKIAASDKVDVTLKTGGSVTGVPAAPKNTITGNATVTDGTTPEAPTAVKTLTRTNADGSAPAANTIPANTTMVYFKALDDKGAFVPSNKIDLKSFEAYIGGAQDTTVTFNKTTESDTKGVYVANLGKEIGGAKTLKVMVKGSTASFEVTSDAESVTPPTPDIKTDTVVKPMADKTNEATDASTIDANGYAYFKLLTKVGSNPVNAANITFKEGGFPVQGVEVVAGTAGVYRVKGLAAGTYNIVADGVELTATLTLKSNAVTPPTNPTVTEIKIVDVAGTDAVVQRDAEDFYIKLMAGNQALTGTVADMSKFKGYRNDNVDTTITFEEVLNSKNNGIYHVKLNKKRGVDTITVDYNGVRVATPALTDSITVGKIDTINTGTDLSGANKKTVNVTLNGVEASELQIREKKDGTVAGNTATGTNSKVIATINGASLELSSAGALSNEGTDTFVLLTKDGTVTTEFTVTVAAPAPTFTIVPVDDANGTNELLGPTAAQNNQGDIFVKIKPSAGVINTNELSVKNADGNVVSNVEITKGTNDTFILRNLNQWTPGSYTVVYKTAKHTVDLTPIEVVAKSSMKLAATANQVVSFGAGQLVVDITEIKSMTETQLRAAVAEDRVQVLKINPAMDKDLYKVNAVTFNKDKTAATLTISSANGNDATRFLAINPKGQKYTLKIWDKTVGTVGAVELLSADFTVDKFKADIKTNSVTINGNSAGKGKIEAGLVEATGDKNRELVFTNLPSALKDELNNKDNWVVEVENVEQTLSDTTAFIHAAGKIVIETAAQFNDTKPVTIKYKGSDHIEAFSFNKTGIITPPASQKK